MKNILLLLLVILFGNSLWAQELEWALAYGSGAYSAVSDITTDSQGNIYACGFYEGTADFDFTSGVFELTSNGEADIFLAKYDANGNLIWAISLGGSQNDRARALKLDDLGNIYVGGGFWSTMDFDPGPNILERTPEGWIDSYIAKFSNDGNLIWVKTIGGSEGDDIYDLNLDSEANIYVSGYFMSTVDFNPGPADTLITSNGITDIYAAKYNSDGDFQWVRTAGSTDFDYSYSSTIDESGAVYLTGYFRETLDFDVFSNEGEISTNDQDVFLTKYTSSGDFEWVKRIGGDVGWAIEHHSSGLYLTGTIREPEDFDPGPGLAQPTTYGELDIFLAKYDPDGNYLWAHVVGSTSRDEGRSLGLDESGNVYFGGRFYGTVDFDAGSNVADLTAPTFWDSYILKYSAQGVYQWAFGLGADSGMNLAFHTTAAGGLFIGGCFNGTADFDPSNNNLLIASSNESDAYLARYSAIVTDLPETKFENGISLHPNPFDDEILLTNRSNSGPMEVTIYNAMGKLVRSQSISATQDGIDLGLAPSGLYHVRVTQNQGVKSFKVVKR